MSVRVRLTLWYAGTLGLVLVVFALSLIAVLQRRLTTALDAQLADDKEVAEQLLQRVGDGIELKATGHGGAPPLGFSLVVQAVTGAVLLSLPGDPVPTWGATALPGWRDVRTIGDGALGVRVFSDPESIDGLSVVMHVGRSMAGVHEQLATIGLVSLLLLPVGVLIAAAGGLFLARKALLPVANIAAHAQRLSAERLGERLPVANPRDEFGSLARTFNEMQARLERSFAQLRQFTADASHELRTPLTALRSVGEVGLRNARDADALRDVVASMLEEADRLTRLVDALLLLARSDSGALPMTQSTFPLQEIAREAVAVLAVLAEEKHLTLAITANADPEVRGDRTLVRQILVNLVHNAIQHSRERGAIAVEIDVAGDTACCRVRDSGPGVRAEHRERVFERFFRADPGRQQDGGAGLGLALARSIARLHSGDVELVEHAGTGAAFRLWLPKAASAPAPRGNEQT